MTGKKKAEHLCAEHAGSSLNFFSSFVV